MKNGVLFDYMPSMFPHTLFQFQFRNLIIWRSFSTSAIHFFFGSFFFFQLASIPVNSLFLFADQFLSDNSYRPVFVSLQIWLCLQFASVGPVPIGGFQEVNRDVVAAWGLTILHALNYTLDFFIRWLFYIRFYTVILYSLSFFYFPYKQFLKAIPPSIDYAILLRHGVFNYVTTFIQLWPEFFNCFGV